MSVCVCEDCLNLFVCACVTGKEMTFPYTGLVQDVCMKYHIPVIFPYA